MDVIESMAVNLLHDVGSCPSACLENVGIRNVLGVKVTGKEVTERVEGIVWLNTQCLLTLDKTFGDIVGRQVRDISLLTDTVSNGSREQDGSIG